MPAMSDTGAVVAFATTPTTVELKSGDTETTDPATAELESAEAATIADERVWIRDRSADTTRPVAELGSSAPGISGDGCLVAYVVTRESPDSTAALTTVDRCAADPSGPLPIGRVVDTMAATEGVVGAPAVSFDGSTIAWSTGEEIRRYVRGENTLVHEPADVFDVDFVPTPEVRTGERVDVTADGGTVTFVAGPGEMPFAPDPANVYVWSQPDGGPAMIELLSVTAAGLPGAASSGSPSISADGALVAFDSVSADLVALGTEPVTAPFVVVVDRVASTMRVITDDARLPGLSADGAHLVHQRGDALRVVSLDGTVADDRLVADVDPDGPAVMSRHGRWVVFASAALLGAEPADTGTDIWALDLRPSDDGDVIDTTTTIVPVPTTTVAGPTTTDDPTTPVEPPVVVPPSTVAALPVEFPRVTTPYRTFPFPRTSTPTRRTTTSSSSLAGTGAFLTAVATPIRFEPTIVEAGRRTATSTLTAGRATTVASVEVVSGSFAVAADSCSGLSIPAGGSCTVDVDFRPDTVGPVTGFLTFRLGDGSVVSAQLDGDGSAEPTLDPVPAVAAPGQVVTVFGAGFPSGASVELLHGTQRDLVTVDGNGTFAHVFVVMPHTPTGPMELTVVGQVDLFADVTDELLVSSRSLGSGSAAFRDSIVTGLGR